MPWWLPWILALGVLAALAWWAGVRRHRRPSARRPASARRASGTAAPRPRTTQRRPRGGRATDRSRRPGGGRTTAPPRPRGESGATVRPRPGEIWWADVPYEDGTGSKIRPCLVLRVDRGGADVLKITSQDKSERSDHIRIPTKAWDPGADHDSFLDLSDPIRVRADAFDDRAGECDRELWHWVRQLHHLRGGS